MHGLMRQELLRVWEVGLGQHPLDRALTILLAAYPEGSRDTLALLSVGQRDACLFAVREQTFGSRLIGLGTCPACQEQVEFVLDTADMQFVPDVHPVVDAQSIAIDGGELR